MREILVETVNDWLKHKSARLGAALAYYSVFSLGPLLLIVIATAGLLFGEDAARGALSSQFRSMLGETGSQAVEAMLKGASVRTTGTITAVLGGALLLVAALGVVVQLKDALNEIWEAKQPESTTIWGFIRTYLISFAGILALGFMLAMSLVVSTALAAAASFLGGSGAGGLGWQLLNLAASLAVLTLLFAMLFRWFPDTDVAWHDVWPGAIATALLFEIGKSAIAWYIGSQGLESTYGAAASVVVLLIWVYYSSQILLFGAELSHTYARHRRGQGHASALAAQ